MDTQFLDILGHILRAIGWVFLPFLLLPILSLLVPKLDFLYKFQTSIIRIIDGFNMAIGESVKWLLVALVLGTAFSVIALSIFGQSWTKLDEASIYFHAIVILLGSAATLLAGQHVRVDIFYAGANAKTKALTDIVGFYALLIPFCLVLLWNAQNFVGLAWVSLEGSPESDGIRGVFILKTFMSVFALTMLLQGFAIALRGVMLLSGRERPIRPKHIDPLFASHEPNTIDKVEGGL